MLEYEPAAQGMHAVLPVALECVPLAHGLHIPELVAPVSVENVPAGHSRQNEYPEDGSGAYVPALQGPHVELLLAPTAFEYVPLGQGVHVTELLAPISSE